MAYTRETTMHDSADESGAPDVLTDDLRNPSGVFDEILVIGRVVWELAGQSLGRMALVFAAVFVASFLPALLLILGLTVATQTYTRAGLLILVVICLVPAAALVGFNYIAYRGLSDIVKKLGFGQALGAEFITYLEPTGRMRLPLHELTDRLRLFSKETRRDARVQTPGLKGLCFRAVSAMVLYSACLVINRIAKGCIVDGEVDLERLANAIADRADDLLISYFKKILWDLTRLLISLAVLALWLLLYAVITVINLLF